MQEIVGWLQVGYDVDEWLKDGLQTRHCAWSCLLIFWNVNLSSNPIYRYATDIIAINLYMTFALLIQFLEIILT